MVLLKFCCTCDPFPNMKGNLQCLELIVTAVCASLRLLESHVRGLFCIIKLNSSGRCEKCG